MGRYLRQASQAVGAALTRIRAADADSRLPALAPGPWETPGSVTPGPAGWFSLAVEADETGFRLDGRSLTPVELAALVWRCPRWRGRPVLLVTQPAAPAAGAGPVLRQFSVELGAPVYASDAGVRFTFGRALADRLFWCWRPGDEDDEPEPVGPVLPAPGPPRVRHRPERGTLLEAIVAPPAGGPDAIPLAVGTDANPLPGVQPLTMAPFELPGLSFDIRPVALPAFEAPRPDLTAKRPSIAADPIAAGTAEAADIDPPPRPVAMSDLDPVASWPPAPARPAAVPGAEPLAAPPRPEAGFRPAPVAAEPSLTATGPDPAAPRSRQRSAASPVPSATASPGPAGAIRLDPAALRLLSQVAPTGTGPAEPVAPTGSGPAEPVAPTGSGSTPQRPVAPAGPGSTPQRPVGATGIGPTGPDQAGPKATTDRPAGANGAGPARHRPVGATGIGSAGRASAGATGPTPAERGPAAAPWVPVRARTEDGDRERMRASLGWKFQSHSRSVSRALSLHPGLRGAAGPHDGVAGLVAVLALLDTGGERVNRVLRGAGPPDEETHLLARCACAGLVQLPAVGAPVFGVAPDGLDVGTLYRPGEVVVEPAFTQVSLSSGAADAGPLFAIWSATARRLDQLRTPQEQAARGGQAMFAAGCRFVVLGVEAAGPTGAPCVLLRELVFDRRDSALDERVVGRLRAALAARREQARAATPLPWPLGVDAGGRRFATGTDPTGVRRPTPGRTDGHDGA
ncbi:hypothetical protein [Micromonospora sp. DT233]|uniref:hypothetical protein n=1 Tax=Micromonospora sp. DT233 TaxID=3393432 RepID=UPI003CF3CA9D